MPTRHKIARKAERTIWKAARKTAESKRRKSKAIRLKKLAK
jgi:hypothetical protein